MHWSPDESDDCRKEVHGRHDGRDGTRERSGTLMTAGRRAESLENKLRRLAAEAVACKFEALEQVCCIGLHTQPHTVATILELPAAQRETAKNRRK